MSQTLRCFWAIDVAAAVRQRLRLLQQQLGERAPEVAVRWVRPEAMHCTLRFLGDIEAQQVPRLQAAVTEAVAELAPFAVVARGLGAFPSWRRASVLWAGLEAPELAPLAARVEAAVVGCGVAAEARGFLAHVTLGRLRLPRDGATLAQSLAGLEVGELGRFTVAALRLYRSQLQPGGSCYTVLAEVPLPGEAASVIEVAPDDGGLEGAGNGTG